MGTARAPVFGSGRCPACNCRVSNPNARACSSRDSLSVTKTPSSTSPRKTRRPRPGGAAQELADDRRLPRFLEQEAVVAVRRLDHMGLHRLFPGAEAPRG